MALNFSSKVKCLVFGHKLQTATCPFTKAVLSSCSRCGKGSHSSHSKMSFK